MKQTMHNFLFFARAYVQSRAVMRSFEHTRAVRSAWLQTHVLYCAVLCKRNMCMMPKNLTDRDQLNYKTDVNFCILQKCPIRFWKNGHLWDEIWKGRFGWMSSWSLRCWEMEQRRNYIWRTRVDCRAYCTSVSLTTHRTAHVINHMINQAQKIRLQFVSDLTTQRWVSDLTTQRSSGLDYTEMSRTVSFNGKSLNGWKIPF